MMVSIEERPMTTLHAYLVEEAETEDTILLETFVIAEFEEEAVALAADLGGDTVTDFCARTRVSVRRIDNDGKITLQDVGWCGDDDCDGCDACGSMVDVVRTTAEWMAEHGNQKCVFSSTDF